MNKWVKRKWLRALKSGEYGKGKGALGARHYDEYCCLGVLVCEMVPEFTHEESDFVGVDNRDQKYGDYYDTWIPDDLAALWGLDEPTQRQLGRLNDYNSTFDTVIAYIEDNL